MEDKLITLAILTYSKAQILQSVLENEGIESYIHNVNLIQPVISSGVRVRIKESDLPQALKIIESSSWLSSEILHEESPASPKASHVLIPIDFSPYWFSCGCKDACRCGVIACAFYSYLHSKLAIFNR